MNLFYNESKDALINNKKNMKINNNLKEIVIKNINMNYPSKIFKKIRNIIMNEGSTMPRVANIDPKNFRFLYPIYVARFIAIGPGVDSAMTVISIISSCVIHFFFSTQVCSISDNIA